MSVRIYKGRTIEAKQQHLKTGKWTTRVRIFVHGGYEVTATDYFAKDEWDTEEKAIRYCILFGKQIIDGKVHPEPIKPIE